MIGEAVTDDARTDDDRAGPGGDVVHVPFSPTPPPTGTGGWRVPNAISGYSTGISLLTRLRSIPCRLRTIRAVTKTAIASTYIAPM